MKPPSTKEDQILGLLTPSFQSSDDPETPRVQSVIDTLGLIPHVEGGYFKPTDTSPNTVPNPYPLTPQSEEDLEIAPAQPDLDASLRRASTTIFYYLTPKWPMGKFHANRSRIIHTLHRGRGRYVLIHPDGRLETFVVGQNIEAGERLSWVVEGGVWKASYLLSEGPNDKDSGGLLISETVVPGFEYADHEFLTASRCKELLPEHHATSLDWLVRKTPA